MASIGDVFLRLLLDDSDFEKQVIQAGKKAGDKAGLSMGQQIAAGISKTSTQIGQSLAGIGQGLTKTGRGLTTNLTLPLLAAGGAVTHFALDFDTTMRRIEGLAKVPAEEIAGIREEILQMGADVGRTPQELGEAFYFVASAGFNAKEAMDVLRIAAKAAAAGMGQTQDVAKVLGGVINAYGHENITAARAGDILTAAIQDGAAEASDFAGAIGMVVPNAAALGVSFDQVAAAMSAMTQVGIDAQTAAVNLGQILSALQKPSVQAEDAMKGLGLSSAGLRQELKEKGLLETLRTLEERFRGNETASALVFGNIRALRGVSALLGMDTKQLNAIFGDTADALGTLQGAYDATEGPQRRLDKAMASLQASAIALGEDVLPQVVEVVESITDGVQRLARWWKSLDADTRKQIITWLAWSAAVGPALLIAGKLVTGLSALFKVIGFLAGAKGIPALVGGITKARLQMFGWLGVILAITAGLEAASGPISDFFDELQNGKKANKVLHELNDLTGDMMKAQVLRALGIDAKEFAQAVEKAGGDVEYAFDAIKDNAGDLGKALDQLGDEAEPTALFKGWGTRDPTKIQAALDAAKEKAKGFPDGVAAELVDGQFVVRDAAEEMASPIDDALEKARAASAEQTRGLISDLASILATGPDEIKDEVQALVDALIDPFTTTERSLTYAGALARDAFRIAFTKDDPKLEVDTFNKINDLLAQYDLLKPGAFDIGAEVPPNLQAGVTSTIQAAVNYFKTKIRPDLIKPFDIADDMDRQGYHVLAEYVRGQERARVEKLETWQGNLLRQTKAAALIDLAAEGKQTFESWVRGREQARRDKLQAELDATLRQVKGALIIPDAWQLGYDSAVNYASGFRLGGVVAINNAAAMVGAMSKMMNFSGSPPYTHAREYGEGVATHYMDQLIAYIKSGLPRLGGVIGQVASTLALQPMGLAAASVPSMGAYASQAGSVAASTSTVNNTWQLVVNGVPYTFNTRDDFIKALDDLSAFQGDGRLS